MRTPSATMAVSTLPVSCTSPVPTRLRMPSASFITREISTPVWVVSKNRTGSRMMCASMRRRMSVMAFWAATPRICESPKDEIACTSVAPAAIHASLLKRSMRPLPTTSSIRNLESEGSTNPAPVLMSINTSPIASRQRRAMMSSRASSQAADQRIFFFLGSSGIGEARPRVEAEPLKNTRLARGGSSPVRAGPAFALRAAARQAPRPKPTSAAGSAAPRRSKSASRRQRRAAESPG